MWGYYGSKGKIVDYYEPPKFNKIIEPFAGTARYSLKYFDRDVILIDKYEVIIKIWKWLQQCSPNDILSLPRIQYGQNINDFNWDCDEQKWLMGFLITASPSQPKLTPSKWKTIERPNTQNYKLSFIADNLYKIKHWNIILGDYQECINEQATWFIDPPYQNGGQYYKYGNDKIDYTQLSKWCAERNGQVIVCGNNNDSWLDFEPLIKYHGSKKNTIECVKYFYNT